MGKIRLKKGDLVNVFFYEFNGKRFKVPAVVHKNTKEGVEVYGIFGTSILQLASELEFVARRKNKK